jgi:hypothetical protein
LVARIQIFRPSEYDRELVERAREVVKLAKKVLTESDPSILSRWPRPEPPSESPVANCREPVDATGLMRDQEEQMRAVAHIMEILREGGYHCEINQDTLH